MAKLCVACPSPHECAQHGCAVGRATSANVPTVGGYRIVNMANSYGNKWLVVRMVDERIVHSANSPSACCRWVNTWGGTLGRTKPGQGINRELKDLLDA